MKGYGQFCPVAKAVEVFCERWTALILRLLGGGVTRFSKLHHGIPLMSRSALAPLKAKWDPANLFRHNHNITPATSA